MSHETIDPLANPAGEEFPFRDILRAVIREFGFGIVDLRSDRRSSDVVLVRQAAMLLVKTFTPHSLTWIGRQFRRDHTTVLHAMRRAGERIIIDPDYAAAVARCVAALRAGDVVDPLAPAPPPPRQPSTARDAASEAVRLRHWWEDPQADYREMVTAGTEQYAEAVVLAHGEGGQWR